MPLDLRAFLKFLRANDAEKSCKTDERRLEFGSARALLFTQSQFRVYYNDHLDIFKKTHFANLVLKAFLAVRGISSSPKASMTTLTNSNRGCGARV